MEPDWQEFLLEDCMDAIIDYRGKTPTKTESGIPLITAKIIKDGRISPVSEYIAEDDYDSWMRRGIPLPGDVVMTTEAPLGEIAQLDERKVALAQRVITLRGKAGLLDNTFLKYLMLSHHVQHQLDGRGTGTTVKGIKQSELRQVLLKFPNFPKQRAIAHVLGSLDDKIELNRQINTTLENMAQALFKSWFVDFDPVLDNALAAGNPIPDALADKAAARKALGNARKPLPEDIRKLFPAAFVWTEEMGWVPEGWSTGCLNDLSEKITDGSHQSPSSVDKAIGRPMASSKDLTATGINQSSCRYISVDDFQSLVSNGCSPKIGDVLISKDGSRCGETSCIYHDKQEIVLLSSVAIIRPRQKEYSNFIHSLLIRRETVADLRENYVSGSAIPRIVLKDFKRYPIISPPESILKKWDQITSSTYKSSRKKTKEIEALAKLRDTLLPKLLSGELRIPDAEKLIEEALQ